MKWLAGRYTQRINYRDGRDGPLFRGRFASVVIGCDSQLVLTSRYIHLNPVEAGVVTEPSRWLWSSAGAYLNVRPSPDWLHKAVILDLFDKQQPALSYNCYLTEGIELLRVKKVDLLVQSPPQQITSQHTVANSSVMLSHGVRPAGSDPSL
jgi:putative transposase